MIGIAESIPLDNIGMYVIQTVPRECDEATILPVTSCIIQMLSCMSACKGRMIDAASESLSSKTL